MHHGITECTGEPSPHWQRRWLIRQLIKFNKITLDKLPYPEWCVQNPTLYNYTRRTALSTQSHHKLSATTNEIRAAMTSSPSSPEGPENKYSQKTAPKDSNEACNHPEKTKEPATPRTRRIKRFLTRELNHTFQPNHQQDDTNAN